MKRNLFLVVALFCLTFPCGGWAGCPSLVASVESPSAWRGTGLTLEVFEQWLRALPPSPTSERVARTAIQTLMRSRESLAEPPPSEWEIANAINAGLKERTPHDRIVPLTGAPVDKTRVGLGFDFVLVGDAITIYRVWEDSPAAQHGIKLGDRIEGVNEWKVGDEGPDSLTRRLVFHAKQLGSPLLLKIRRANKLLDFSLEPEPINIPGNVAISTIALRQHFMGVVTVRGFKCGSVELDVAEALDTLRDKGVEGIVLDLRSNSGGRVDAVTRIAGYFLGKKKLLLEEEPLTPESRPAQHFTHSQARIQVPLMVLIDQGTASAAEILAGALQYYQQAYLVGTPSYGKGTMQTPHSEEAKPFEKLPVALFATSSLYYLPGGVTPQGRGLQPDFEVHQPFPTLSQFFLPEHAMRNSVAVKAPWNPGPAHDPLREWLKASGLRPNIPLPDGDRQKEVALKLLLEWIEIKGPTRAEGA